MRREGTAPPLIMMRTRLPLLVIILVYLLLGALYAVETPPWEAPDEPAHYNYIAYLVEEGRFPVLQMGDWPNHYLKEIKAAQFPPDMSIAPIRYEFHQPPLYYLLAAPIYGLARSWPLGQQVVILRFFSLLQGAFLLAVAYAAIKEVFGHFLALTAVAFMATVPMHLAMTAAINNDTLGELVLASVVWLCLLAMKGGWSRGRALLGGILLGAALLTKTTIYAPAAAAIAVAGLYRWKRNNEGLNYLGLIFGVGLALSSWWFLRNGLVYGGLDIFGWGRHDAIVVGQPTTAEWVSRFGARKVFVDFLAVSFRSFWAQFGWMGVLVDSRIYDLLFVLCLAIALGLLVRIWRGERLGPLQKWSLGLLLIVFLLVFASHLWYNLKFVQHQGRYLFPALLSIGLVFALGLKEWARLLSAAISLPKLSSNLAERIVLGGFYALFVLLDLVCLYGFIVPYFA